MESGVAMGVLDVDVTPCSLQLCNAGGMAPARSIVQGCAAILCLHSGARLSPDHKHACMEMAELCVRMHAGRTHTS